jgi:hypothetical protein
MFCFRENSSRNFRDILAKTKKFSENGKSHKIFVFMKNLSTKMDENNGNIISLDYLGEMAIRLKNAY